MMQATCYVQIDATYSKARADYGALKRLNVRGLTQEPPRQVYGGSAVVKVVFEIDETIFTNERYYPTAVIQVDQAVADLRPALVTAMAAAKF